MTNLRLVTVLALAACGTKKTAAPAAGSAAAPTSTPAMTAAAATGSPSGSPAGKCSFTVSGDVTLSVEGIATKDRPNGKAMAVADYWQTDDQLRGAIQAMAGLDSRKSKQEIAAAVDEGMKRDPKFMLLTITCGADLGAIDFGPGKDSKYADVPFKPGTYAIATTPKAGELGALINLRPPGKHQSFKIAEPGTLEVTKFDLTGITGTFVFKAKSLDGAQTIEVHGSFDYPCVGAACKS